MTNKGFFKSYRGKSVLYKKKDIGTHVAVYIEDKYIVLGFNDYKGCGILGFTRKGQKGNKKISAVPYARLQICGRRK